MKRLLVSFSGGETSGYMLGWILANWRNRFDQIAVVFANTGQEREECLVFVDKCSRYFNVPIYWIESVVFHGKKKASGFKLVNFESASRDGTPFEEMIKKYGIPNSKFPHCTRELKVNPIRAFAADFLKWQHGSYYTAIGIRSDEIDRMSTERLKNNILYPLIKENPITKPQINDYWRRQPFRLQSTGYQGNCAWCWKKSDRKHYTLLNENPRIYDFPERMEREYGNIGPEFKKYIRDGYLRKFFRNNRTVMQLRSDALNEIITGKFTPASDDAVIYDSRLDLGGGCGDGESCEVFTSDNEKIDPITGEPVEDLE